MSSSSFWDHPIATIEKALHIRKQIEALQASLAEILTTNSPTASLPLMKEGNVVEHSTAAPFSTGKRRGRPRKVVVEAVTVKVDGRKKPRSAATKAKMAAAAKARWAAKKAGGSPVEAAPKKKNKMSPEGRARIAAAQKARWAAKKKQ